MQRPDADGTSVYLEPTSKNVLMIEMGCSGGKTHQVNAFLVKLLQKRGRTYAGFAAEREGCTCSGHQRGVLRLQLG